MANLAIKDLLEAGVHFGHQTRRWNPKMKKYIFTERNDIYIIDLQKTLSLVNKACDTIRSIVAKGGSVLFVGTKPQAATIIREEAEKCGQFYVVNRWLGGMLTNYRTIRQSVKRLEHYERMATDGTYDLITKKEILTTEKHKDKLQMMLGGIRDMNRIPGLMIVVDTKREHIAVREANRMNIPVCAIVDTNSDPDLIDYPIPGNDDAIRSIKVILSQLTNAVLEGLHMREEKESLELAEVERQKAEDPSKHGQRKGKQGGKTGGKARSGSKAAKQPRSKSDADRKDDADTSDETKSESADSKKAASVTAKKKAVKKESDSADAGDTKDVSDNTEDTDSEPK